MSKLPDTISRREFDRLMSNLSVEFTRCNSALDALHNSFAYCLTSEDKFIKNPHCETWDGFDKKFVDLIHFPIWKNNEYVQPEFPNGKKHLVEFVREDVCGVIGDFLNAFESLFPVFEHVYHTTQNPNSDCDSCIDSYFRFSNKLCDVEHYILTKKIMGEEFRSMLTNICQIKSEIMTIWTNAGNLQFDIVMKN